MILVIVLTAFVIAFTVPVTVTVTWIGRGSDRATNKRNTRNGCISERGVNMVEDSE